MPSCRMAIVWGWERKIFCVVASALAALALAACGSGGSSTGGTGSTGKEGGTLLGAYAAFPDYLDPALSHTGEGWTAMYDTYIPLLTYAHANGAAGGKVIPGWRPAMPKVSADGKTYTLKLREGLRYSNGEPVRASDFTHALERVYRLNSGGSPFYDDIVGAEASRRPRRAASPAIETDDKTGRDHDPPDPPARHLRERAGAAVRRPPPRQDPERRPLREPASGHRPLRHHQLQAGLGLGIRTQSAVGEERTEADAADPFRPRRQDQIQVLRNPQTRGQRGRSRSSSTGWRTRCRRTATRKSPPEYEGSQFRVEPTVSTYFFWMNTTTAPFDDVKVRQAVNYAIDPRALERIYSGRLEGSQQILPTGMPGGAKLDLYPHDLSKAKELIAEANPSDREITVWTESEPPSKDVGAYYQGVLEELGFKVTLKVLGPDNYFNVIGNTSTPNLDTGWANWFEDYPHPNDFFQPLLAEESIAPVNGTNLSRFADPRLIAEDHRTRGTAAGAEAGSRLRPARPGIHGRGADGALRVEHRLDLRLQLHQPRQRDLQPDLRPGPDELRIQVDPTRVRTFPS